MTDSSPPDSKAAAPPSPEVRRSLDACRIIARERARNFYYGMMLTPEPRRSAMYAVYAFMRACDDLVDAPPEAGGQPSVEEGLARIERFRTALDQLVETGDPGPDAPAPAIWPGFGWVMQRFELDREPLDEMLAGQQQDLTDHRYETFAQLRNYCYRVASTVGLVCIDIWGYRGGEATRQLAIDRGLALQLTNILRDVVEDAERNRVYLPGEDLERFDLEADTIAEGGPGFEEMIRFEAERALGFYESSAPLEAQLNGGCRATCRALTGIYRKLLEKILADPASVLDRRVRVSTPAKLAVAASALGRRVVGR
ncbi:MAG: phytoene/squalene synthase family protein [Phycisphaeraceae bacterium]|nr:phytoene/squalene synthase family protein [Phycisphaeraceae bacterium]